MLKPNQTLAIFMENAVLDSAGKMGFGVLRYSQNPIACVIDSSVAGQSLRELTGITRDVPIVASVQEAVALGAEVLVLGIAPPGGSIPDDWYPIIDAAVGNGMSVINGLHDHLGPRYPSLREGQWMWDVRVEPEDIGVGFGDAAAMTNKRVLFIGTDMAVGKMTAGLELYRALIERGTRVGFVATGQIGITITGSGIPLDAIRVDFASGAVEKAVLSHSEAEVVIIEGQGALIHPGSTANLPLMRGSMPTHFILCHRAGARTLERRPGIMIPPLGDYIRMYEDLASACGSFPRPETLGVCLNTSKIGSDEDALSECNRISEELGLPVTDPIRFGIQPLVDRLS